MRRKLLAVSTVIVALLAFGITTAALAGGGNDRYGPYPSGSPDSGTCGNIWAEDTFDRYYRVDSSPNEDGTYTVREDFKDGTFVTNAGPSPGACETNPGGVVPAGVTGRMHGYFIIIVSGGTYNPDAVCPPGCTTDEFVRAFFGPTATYDIPTFLFQYSASSRALCSHHWKNASEDRGGNKGDIASTCSS